MSVEGKEQAIEDLKYECNFIKHTTIKSKQCYIGYFH